MSFEESAAEVAEDYSRALEDLTMNSRVEIMNLTSIARDNTEYAHAISETLLNHVKRVNAQRKLPALYLLDSIVKNVGTPYTIFFGRKLYNTYMEAYASVDNGTRRKMEEMLRTWKEPVPGSIDTRPVFSIDLVRPIENALLKAKTSAMQSHQELRRTEQQLLGRRPSMPGGPAFRDTPTPPDLVRGLNQSPGPYGQPQSYTGVNGNGQVPPPGTGPNPYPYNTPVPHHSASASGPYPPAASGQYGSDINVEALNRDIERLIAASKAEFAQSPLDASVQGRLKALLELQGILRSQNLPQEQLVLIKNQVSELAVKIRDLVAGPSLTTTTYTPTPSPLHQGLQQPAPQPQQPQQQQQQQQQQHRALPIGVPATAGIATPPVIPVVPSVPPVGTAVTAPAAPGGTVSIDSLFGKGALAALLGGRPQSATPTQSTAALPSGGPVVPVVSGTPLPLPQASGPEAPKPAVTPLPTDPSAILGLLRSSGLLKAGQTGPGSAMMTPTPTPVSIPHIPGTGIVPPPHLAGLAPGVGGIRGPSIQDMTRDIVLKPSSLKQFRPHLLPFLYEDLGPPCSQCGRRFRTDEEGRRKKTAHMDWHFRVHQRIAEAEKRGQHRSWYVDYMDWIQSREVVDADNVGPSDDAAGGAAASASATTGGSAGVGPGGASETGLSGLSAHAKGPTKQWIPVPDDGGATNSVCPICQEKFESQWLDEAQEWVWMDAVRVNGRVYHASCHAEAAKDKEKEGTPLLLAGARATPEPGGGGGGGGGAVLGKRKAEDELAHLRGRPKTDGS